MEKDIKDEDQPEIPEASKTPEEPEAKQEIKAKLQPENEFEIETHEHTKGHELIKEILKLPNNKLLVLRWKCARPTIYNEDGTIYRTNLFAQDANEGSEIVSGENGDIYLIVGRPLYGGRSIKIGREGKIKDIEEWEKCTGIITNIRGVHIPPYTQFNPEAADNTDLFRIMGKYKYTGKEARGRNLVANNVETVSYNQESQELYWANDSVGAKRAVIVITDVSHSTDEWSQTSMNLESIVRDIEGATSDKKRNFLIVVGRKTVNLSVKGVFIIDRKSGKIVKEIPGEFVGPPFYVNGDILVNTPKNTLRRITTNFDSYITKEEVEKQKTKVAKIRRLKAKREEKKPEKYKIIEGEIEEKQKEILEDTQDEIKEAENLKELEDILSKLNASLEAQAKKIGDRQLVEEIFRPAKEKLQEEMEKKLEEEKEVIGKKITEEIQSIREQIPNLSVRGIETLSKKITELAHYKGDRRVEKAQTTEITKLGEEFEKEAQKIFQEEAGEIEENIKAKMGQVEEELKEIDSYPQFEEWLDYDFPSYLKTLEQYRDMCPVRNKAALATIKGAIQKLTGIKEEYEKKFRVEYAKIRTGAQEKREEQTQTILNTIKSFKERVDRKIAEREFQTGEEAERWINQNQTYITILDLIEILRKGDRDAAEGLEDQLKTGISNTLYTIERLAHTKTDEETGQLYEPFGDFPFPKWEGKVKEKAPLKIDLRFEVEKQTIGAGVTPKDYMGHLYYEITDEYGKKRRHRVFEEEERHYGLRGEWEEMRGYITANEAKKLLAGYKHWQHEGSALKKEYGEFRKKHKEALKNLGIELKKAKKDGNQERVNEIKQIREEKLKEYLNFLADKGIWLYQILDRKKENGELERENGKGLVPEWSNHWVTPPYIEKKLQKIAEEAKMSLDLQEGVINLYGHAGTGKDVNVKMFCNRTNRPYFRFDCTKWTTEAELGEDIILESEEGAPKTIRVPSNIIKGIQTPGAVVYLNEITAMPETAQIFLHGLFDESRSMTLKTRPGVEIKAHPTAIFMSSMNPNSKHYTGTFEPQFATKSRMISINIDYPPLKDENGDFDPSEPLMVARSIYSFKRLTRDPDMKKNEFVKLWNAYVNNEGEVDRTSLTAEQEFDLNVIMALTQFGNKLREGFINLVEKTTTARKALLVPQPFTLREMRRCAYRVSQMKPEEKSNPLTAEETARKLIRRYFLSHIFEQKKVEEIDNAMKTWTVEKKMAAPGAAV